MYINLISVTQRTTYLRHPAQRLLPGASTPQTAHTGVTAAPAAAPDFILLLGILRFLGDAILHLIERKQRANRQKQRETERHTDFSFVFS